MVEFNPKDFNPPTPWGVGHSHAKKNLIKPYFNPPTPWGVGRLTSKTKSGISHFNPPTPWGVGPRRRHSAFAKLRFQSTHSVGSGTAIAGNRMADMQFQSTHSVGSGTGEPSTNAVGKMISIHPLRGEWDVPYGLFAAQVTDFNPPTPWGVGPSVHLLFTPFLQISIHPLRGEWDATALPVFPDG